MKVVGVSKGLVIPLVIIILVLGIVMIYLYPNSQPLSTGQQLQSSPGVASSSNQQLQEAMRIAETRAGKLLSLLMDKLAAQSESKYIKGAYEGLGIIAGILKEAANSSDITMQNNTLCKAGSVEASRMTSMAINDPNISRIHNDICSKYQLLINMKQQPPTSDTLDKFLSVLSDIVYYLVQLDNIIVNDP